VRLIITDDHIFVDGLPELDLGFDAETTHTIACLQALSWGIARIQALTVTLSTADREQAVIAAAANVAQALRRGGLH